MLIVNGIYNLLIEVVLICLGIYYTFNYKSEAKKSLERSPDSMKIFNFEYKFHKPKVFIFLYPYLVLLVGLWFFTIGILALFHLIKFNQ